MIRDPQTGATDGNDPESEPVYAIALAQREDLAHIPEIELAAARLLVGHAPEPVLAEVTSAAELELAWRSAHLWVAKANERAVGFAHVKVFEPRSAHLDELDVHPDHGRRGLGRRLVTAVCDWAARAQFEAVTLCTFRDVPWNRPFYETLGFEVVRGDTLSPALTAVVDDETRRGLDPDRRVVMRRVLSVPRHPMNVRRADPDDRERLLDLWERSVRATHHFLTESDIIGLRPLVANELSSDAIDWWVFEADGAPVGFLGFANDTIEGLFIDPEHQGRGAGTALVEHAQQLAGGTLSVDVNEQNDAALKFYEARGFVVIGRSPTDTAGRPFPLLHMKRIG